MTAPRSRNWSATHAPRAPAFAMTGAAKSWRARRPWKKCCASPARTRRAVGAFEYTALDAQGRERKGLIEGDTAKHVRQLLRDKQLLPMEIQEAAQRELKQSRAPRLHAARPLESGFGALDPPAGDTAALRPAVGGIAASGCRTDGKAARPTHHPRRAQQGGRRPSLGGWAAGLSAGVPGDLSSHRLRRRAVGQARFGARAALRLHRITSGDGPAGEQRARLPDRAARALVRHRLLPVGLRRAAGGRGIRVRSSRAAHRHPYSHRHERSDPPLLVLRAHRHCGGDLGLFALAQGAGGAPALRSLPAARCRSPASSFADSTRRDFPARSAFSPRARCRCSKRCASRPKWSTTCP